MKQQKKVSHTGYWKAIYTADERAVLFFTGMTAGELMDMKLDMGQEWLVKHLAAAGINKADAEILWASERVLKWWNLNWRQYDHFYVLPYLHKVIEGERENVYKDMHLNIFRPEHPQYRALHEQLLGLVDLILVNVDEEKEVKHAA